MLLPLRTSALFGLLYCLNCSSKRKKLYHNFSFQLPVILSYHTGQSHGLPGLVHVLNVLFCFHSQSSNARAALVYILQWVFVWVWCGTLVWRRSHALHPLAHRWVRVSRVWGRVKKAVAGIAGLEALWWAHESWYAVHWCGTGQRRGQPRVQGKRVCH